MKATISTLIISILLAVPVFGENTNNERSDEYVSIPVNISVVPGFSVGESVARGRKVVNHVSLSMLVGRASKLNGVEMSGLSSHYSENIKGLQCAGIANTAGENGVGAQWSGIANISGGGFTGAQWAGTVNYNHENFLGAQWAGIANMTNGSFKGTQWAGIFNAANDTFTGLQMAGIANAVNNLDDGIQVSGIVNIAKKAGRKSLQVGLINVSDENDGIPVGLVSYVRETGLRYDLWTDEARFMNIGLRTGNDRYYNILFAGAQMMDSSRWSVGWAFGRHTNIGTSHYIDADIGVRHINEAGWTEDTNMVSTARIIGGWQVNDTFSLFAGPTINYFVSDVNDGSDLASWSMKESKSGSRHERWWPGFVFGVKIYQ